ncbi:MAG: hypothetical protein CMM07_16705 [Rhodopirellula sp.]|nr:hypothetical protein [Rhodopirellula sp.]
MEMIRRHIERHAPYLGEITPSCPADLSILIAKLLAKPSVEGRLSAAEVIICLQTILQEQMTHHLLT